jgi:D-alanyl-D-alanine endopeptidase (penicillin-binding protein 7)
LVHKIVYPLVFLTLFGNWTNVHSKSVSAKSWLVSDIQGQVIRGEDIDAVRPIASITKLMTAMVVLDAKQDLEEYIELSRKLSNKLPARAKLTRRNLIEMSMVKSDNRASLTLCEHYPKGYNACITAMNAKAASLGMTNTRFADPTGLDNHNVSTARDLINLVKAARSYGIIIDSSQKAQLRVRMNKYWLIFNNTNPMVVKNTKKVLVGKTGFTNPAGGCIVLLLDTDHGDRIVVVLGSQNTRTRIPEAEFISDLKEED